MPPCVLLLCCGAGRRHSTDTVAFSVQAASSGPITVRLLGVAPWGTVPRSNLNATVTVRNAQGTVLAAASGVGVGPLTVNAAAAGVYYIMVAPTGAGNPLTTGYSAYGSIGQYELVVTYPVSAAADEAAAQWPSKSCCSRMPLVYINCIVVIMWWNAAELQQ